MRIYVEANVREPVYEVVASEFEVVGSVEECEAVITIGGDGTILRAAKSAALLGKPLLGINTGRLGFMATLEKDELCKLSRLKRGEFTTSRRMLLDVRTRGETRLALNEVVLHREATARLSEITVSRGAVEVLKFRADGVIISSPTGSTAYSLSAGGPIIEPELECFMVTAVCPHTLFNRPMLFTTDAPIVATADGARIIIDGAEVLTAGSLTVTKSAYYLDLIDIDGNSFYNSIHNKLMRPLK
jgi:NAD+ kinase